MQELLLVPVLPDQWHRDSCKVTLHIYIMAHIPSIILYAGVIIYEANVSYFSSGCSTSPVLLCRTG
jgi:hypothetical protein